MKLLVALTLIAVPGEGWARIRLVATSEGFCCSGDAKYVRVGNSRGLIMARKWNPVAVTSAFSAELPSVAADFFDMTTRVRLC